MCNAVRDNPERVQFVGYDPHVVRYFAFCFSGFFAGIAGALAAINFEIANSAYLGALQSGTVLYSTYIGGIGYFVGPILGAILITLMQILLSDVTAGWQMYLGILFVVVVIYAPGGLAALFSPQVMVSRGWHSPLRALLVIPLLLAALGGMLLIELGYQAGLKSSERPIRVLFGISINSSSWLPWCLAIASVIAEYTFWKRLVG
jgi:branched-chain amino acid transport system permease protein